MSQPYLSSAARWGLNNLVKVDPAKSGLKAYVGFNAASGIGDFVFQTAKNGFDISMNNYMSTFSNLVLGPLPASFVGAASDLNFAKNSNFVLFLLNRLPN